MGRSQVFARRTAIAAAVAASLFGVTVGSGLWSSPGDGASPNGAARESGGGAWAQSRAVCLSDIAADSALVVSVVSEAPTALCESAYRLVEIRNRSGAALGMVQLELFAPDLDHEMPFEPLDESVSPPVFFEMSADDGVTWRPIDAPRRIGDKLVWTAAEAPLLARLGPNSAPDDSILLRWRAPLREAYGGAFAPDASVGVAGAAVDACGAVARASRRDGAITALKPSLSGRLLGRNLDRGGAFGEVIPAAPGDVIEWRLEVENAGDAPARELRAELLTPDGPLRGVERADDGPDERLGESGVLVLEPAAPGGRRIATFRAPAPATCGRTPLAARLTFGCARPPSGSPAAILADSEASPAWISSQPDRGAIAITPSVSGEAGRAEPGAVAEILIVLENEGAPAFFPVLEISPPDGFEIPVDAEARVFVSASPAAGRIARAALEPILGGRMLARLLTEDGDAPILGSGDRIELRVDAVRRRPTLGEVDEVSAALLFRDSCGNEDRTPTQRARTTLRQAELELELTPEGSAIVTLDGEAKGFVARVTNTGDARAETVTLSLAPGAAWSVAAPAGCALDGRTEQDGPLYRCVLDGPLAPGETREETYLLALAPELDFDREGGLADGLRLRAAAVAQAADGAGAPAGEILAQAGAEASVIGFDISQTLRTPGGEALDPARAIDLGQQVAIELTARWFGGEGRALEDVALTMVLPAQLGFQNAEIVEGDMTLVGLRDPGVGRSGALLWSFEPIDGAGYVRLRASAVAIDAEAGAPQDARAASLSRGAAEVDAIFTVDGAAFGVDSAIGGPTKAAPLPLLFRRPDLRIGVALSGADQTESDDPRAPAAGAWTAPAGRVVVAEVRLSNEGAGPGYFDWLRMEAPPGVEILPFGSDGVDNDDDGAVDEPDEDAAVFLGPTTNVGQGPFPTEARWSGPGGGALGAGERLIRPDDARVWRAALRMAADTPPARAYTLTIEAQFGAQPVQELGDGPRSRALARPVLGAAPITGWLVLTETSFGGDIDEVVRTGELVDHRLTLRLPPGRIADAVIAIDFDPGLGAPQRLDARFGPAVECDAEPQGRVTPRTNGPGLRGVWRLGDCAVDTDAPADARLIIIDVVSEMSDAPAEMDGNARDIWRAPKISGGVSYVDAAAPSGRGRAALGDVKLQIVGPSMRLSLGPVTQAGADDPEDLQTRRLDAGDTFEGRLRLANVGDRATRAALVRFGWANAEAAAARGVDCTTLNAGAVEAGARVVRSGVCQTEVLFDFTEKPLEPGETVELLLRGELSADAPIGGVVETPVVAFAAPEDEEAPIAEGAPTGWQDLRAAPRAEAAWSISVRPPEAPVVEAPRSQRKLSIGDRMLTRGRFRAPEGRGVFELALRFRYEGRDGRAAPSKAPSVRVVALTLERDRIDMRAGADPSRVNAAAVDVPITLLEDDYRVAVDEEGWTEVVAPLGELYFETPSDGLGDGVYLLALAAELSDESAASRGRRLVAEARLRRVDPRPTLGPAPQWTSKRVVVAEITEPFLDLAALHDDPDGSAQLGERVTFIGRACNRGEGPAYGVTLTAQLPDGFGLDPSVRPSFVFDDGPEALGPRPYGVVNVEGNGAIVAVGRDGVPVEPGACLALRLPSFARGRSAASRTPDGFFSANAAEARFEISAYRARATAATPGRLYSGLGASKTVVLRQDLIIDAPSIAYLDADGWVRYPFSVRSGAAADGARLSLFLSGADDLTWTIFLDVNRDGQIDSGDTVWRDGAVLPPGAALGFVARARPEQTPPIGWRRTALLRAAAATADGQLLTGAREIVAARGSQRDGVMSAVRLMAVDRDCDGRVDDETAQDAAFEQAKDVAIGECVIMRVIFSNDGAASVERVQIEDVVPAGARYLDGSATFASTPAGLVGRGVDIPKAGEGGRRRLRFRFVGALAPGLEGVVEYRVRISGAT